jgi:hypothetical protein
MFSSNQKLNLCYMAKFYEAILKVLHLIPGKLEVTSIMYIFKCTCKYCDENHVVLLGIYCNVSLKAQENNVHKNVLNLVSISCCNAGIFLVQ